MGIKRIKSGIKGFDEILKGGFPAHRTYLLIGSPGTGKTIFAVQWLLEQAKRSGNCLFISLAENVKDLKQNMSEFGWDMSKVSLLDLTPSGNIDNLKQGEYHVFSPSEVEHNPVWQKIIEKIEKSKTQFLVIDSVTQLYYMSTDVFQFRKNLLNFVNYLNSHRITTLFTFEPSELESEMALALAVDGLIELHRKISDNRVIEMRNIEIKKLRGSDYFSGFHSYKITAEGIIVYPHLTRKFKTPHYDGSFLKSGLPGLDEQLGGGLETGTITLITGQSGVGKTSLAMQFCAEAVAAGKKAVYFAAEEPVETILKRCEKLKINIRKPVESGQLSMIQLNVSELYPDEFLSEISAIVQTHNVDLVVMDSIRGYNIAMEEYGTLQTHILTLTTLLKNEGVSGILIHEIENLTGDKRLTDFGISCLVDNALLLQYAEIDSRLIRLISCIKKSLGDHQYALRELKVTSAGLEVGSSLTGFRGLLSGLPKKVYQA